MTITFKPLIGDDRQRLLDALRGNAERSEPIRMDRRDTSFVPGDPVPETNPTDEQVISMIRSVPCHYADNRATTLALELLRSSPEYLDDARQGAPVSNSVIGSLLSLPPHSIPRQYAEEGVREALALLDSSQAESAEPDSGGNFTLPRTGKPPLRFQGEFVAEASSHIGVNGGPLQNRWHEIALYRTAAGKLVWSVTYRTRWQGEYDHHTVGVVELEAALIDELTIEYDMLAHYAGYPAGDAYADRDRRQRDAIRLGYERAVAEVLAAADISEEVE